MKNFFVKIYNKVSDWYKKKGEAYLKQILFIIFICIALKLCYDYDVLGNYMEILYKLLKKGGGKY